MAKKKKHVNDKEKIKEMPDAHQWMKKSFKLIDVPNWNFHKGILPLEVTFEGCKPMDLISEDGSKQLRHKINVFADVAEVSERGFLSSSALFYHPFSILTLLRDEGKNLFDIYADPRNARELALNFVKAKFYDSEVLWIGGCPTIAQEKCDCFKATIIEALVQEAKNFSSSRIRKSPILEFTFTAEYDPLRGEIIVVPQIHDPTRTLAKYDIIKEKNEFLENVEQIFKSRLIFWDAKPHLFLVKMASTKYRKLWNDRLEDSNVSLTNKEETLKEWTDEYLNKQLNKLLPKSRKRSSSEYQMPHESQGKFVKVAESPRESHNCSSSSVDKDAIVGDLLLSPSCVDGEYCDAKFVEDREVERVMLKLAQKHDYKEHSRTSPFLSDFDYTAIECQLRSMGFRKPKSKKKRNERTRDELVKIFNINGAPWLTPEVFIHVGKKRDMFGELEFYYAPTAKEIEEQKDIPKMPSYDFINHYDESEMGNEEVRKEDATCPVNCSQTCDMEVGCQPESCPCMKMSAMDTEGLVRKNNLSIYECCRRCPCYNGREKCRSIVRLKPQALQSVFISPMNFTLRTLKNIQRGEVIMPFTGVRQSFVQPEDGIWSFEIPEAKYKSSEFIINSRKAGNAVRFCCHSYSPNCALKRLYRGGMKYVDPEMYLYALGPLEAGDLMYINYGEQFGITRTDCQCTQDLCHKPEELKILKKMTLNEAKTLLIHVEMMKRARMIQIEQKFLRTHYAVVEERNAQSDITSSKIIKEYSSTYTSDV